MARRTLYQMFQETVRKHGDRPAVGFKVGKAADYTYWTYAELEKKVRAFRRGLDALGLRSGESLAILSENRVEWAVADLAAQSLGLVVVAPYATLPAAQIAYIIKDSRARAILVSDEKQLKKIEEIRSELPDLAHLIAMGGKPEALEAAGAWTFEALEARGEAEGRSDAALEKVAQSVSPDAVATLIYTSGTTGDPKGAMLSHMALLQTPDAVPAEPIADVAEYDTFLSFLPLSHITERVAGHYLPLRCGACIVYSQGLSSLVEEIQQTVRPTMMICVPRLWENIAERAKDAVGKAPEKQRKIAQWALRIGTEAAKRKSAGRGLGLILSLQHAVAERLALSKIRAKATGGRLRYCVSGGAPLDPDAATFFLAIGVQMLEGYGLSETSVMFVNRPNRQRIGTVGTMLPNVEVKIAADGEILMRGQGRLAGYYNKPEATAEAIDGEGWFHTGDIGELSQDGYLKITDRKKDILVLTNGKKVAPQPIEAQLKHSPFIGEAVLFGDKQPTVSALLVPAFDKLIAWAKEKEIPTKELGVLLARPEALELYKEEVRKYTSDLADYEKIKRFKMVETPFSIDGGELTPTLKVKRKFVAQKYAELIEAMSR